MIPAKAIKKFTRPSHREIVVGILLAYGLFPKTNDGIDQAKKFVDGLDRWIAPSELPDYYDDIDSDLIIGKQTPKILNIKDILEEFYFRSNQGVPTVENLPIEEIPVEVEINEVEKLPDPVSQPNPEPVKIEIEVPVEKQLNARRKIRLPRAKNRFVRRKSLAQRMAESFDKNLLDPLIEEIKNPKPLPTSNAKKGGTKKQVSKKIFPGKQFSGKFSSSSGSLGSRVISKIGASFGLAAASRKAFKESGGDPRSLRRGYFLSKALGAEFGGDFRRRTRGTFSRNPDATQDPGMSKEERFAEVVKRDLANRPQMMKQGEIFDVDKYTDKTALQSITDLAKKTADKILGLEPGFVRIEKSQTETSKAFVKITQSLSEVKNTFVETADNFKEFVDNKEEVIKIKTKIREVLRKEQDEDKRDAAERQLEIFNDTSGTTDVAETDQVISKDNQDNGGFDLPDFRRPRIRGRLRLLRRRFTGFGRRLGGFGSGIGRRLGGIGRGISSKIKMPNIGRFGGGLGGKLGLKGAGKIGARLIPGVGTAIGLGMAAESFSKGDVFGGIMGLGSAIPGPIGWGFLAGQLLGEGAKSLASKNRAEYDKKNDPNNVLKGLGFSEGGPKSVMPSDGSIPQIVQRDVPWWEKLNPFKMSEGGIVVGGQRSERKLSSGGIVAGEAGNEAVIPLTTSIGKKLVKGLKGDLESGMGPLGSVAPMLSAVAGVVRNPLYGSIVGSVVNPILNPLLSEYKIPVYSADLGLFKSSKIRSASIQSKGKNKSLTNASQNPLTAAFGWLGNLFGGIGRNVSGFFGNIGNNLTDFFNGLFGRRPRRPPPRTLPPGEVDPGVASMTTLTGIHKQAADIITGYESASSGLYNAMNRGIGGDSMEGSKHYLGKNLTDMTIGEIMVLQDGGSPRGRKRLNAAGRYQFNGVTLPTAAADAGLKSTDKFTPLNQDKMFVAHLRKYGHRPWTGPWGLGKYTREQLDILDKAVETPVGASSPPPGSTASAAGSPGLPRPDDSMVAMGTQTDANYIKESPETEAPFTGIIPSDDMSAVAMEPQTDKNYIKPSPESRAPFVMQDPDSDGAGGSTSSSSTAMLLLQKNNLTPPPIIPQNTIEFNPPSEDNIASTFVAIKLARLNS